MSRNGKQATVGTELRTKLLEIAAQEYDTEPEYPWAALPHYAVLRHGDNKKWYALFFPVAWSKLGLKAAGQVEALQVKCEPLLTGSLLDQPGIFPGYFLRQGNWITILLDGTVPQDQILFLLNLSFTLTASPQMRRRLHHAPNRDWIIPANPKYFDLEAAFQESDTIFWRQRSNVSVGDTIYIYMAAPVSAILYACQAIEVDIPRPLPDGKTGRRMRLKLQRRFAPDQLDLETLRACGVRAIRVPRNVPYPLVQAIQALK